MTRAIFLLSLAAFMSAMGMRICDALLPAISLSFDVTVSMAALTITAFAFAYGLMQLAYGPIGARIGPYHTVGYAAVASSLLCLFCGLAPGFSGLVLARMLAGMASAAIIPMSMAYIGGVVAYEDRQSTLAKFMTGQIIGMTSGQALSGIFAEFFSWRSVFFVLAAGFLLVAAALLLEARKLPKDAISRPGNPLVQYRKVLEVPWARVVLLAVFVESLFMFGAFPFMSAHLTKNYGFSYLQIGIMMGTIGLGGLIYALGVKWWLRLLGGEKGLVVAGSAVLALGYLVAATSPEWWIVTAAIILLGLGFYLLHATLQTNATQMAPFDRSAAIALFAFCLFMGQAVGATFFGWLGEAANYPLVFALAALGILGVGAGFRLCLMKKSELEMA